MKILPNLITAIRFVLTPVIVLAILRGEWNQAFWISIAAGITDILDGLAARGLHVSSRIGSYLDPIADKLLLTLIYLAFGIALAIPWWMVALILGRDLFIVAMAAYGYFFTTVRDFPPTVWGKLSTFVQIIAALAVMNNRGGSSIPAGPFLWTMIVTTAWSGIHYGWRGLKMLHAARAAVPS